MSIKLIILDFDGTLVDSRKIIYNIIKKEVNKEEYSLSEDFKEDMGDWPLREHLVKEGININRKAILRRVRSDLDAVKNKFNPARNLKSLADIEQKKIILSNSSQRLIKSLLEKFKIKFISEVHGPKEFHNKAEGIKRVLRKKNLKPSEAVYVGDRDKDILAAKKVGCFAIAISNKISWSSRKEILKAKPDFIISDLRQLKKVVDKLNN